MFKFLKYTPLRPQIVIGFLLDKKNKILIKNLSRVRLFKIQFSQNVPLLGVFYELSVTVEKKLSKVFDILDKTLPNNAYMLKII